jgi:Tfp pilus assembly protein PilX
MPNLIHKNEKGMVLPLGLMFLAIIALLGATAVIVTTTDLKIGSNYRANEQTFYAAEAGWPVAVVWLDGQPVPFLATRQIGTVALGNNTTYSYNLNYQSPPKNIPGYSTEYKDFYYNIDSTANGPANSQSEIKVMASKTYKVGY